MDEVLRWKVDDDLRPLSCYWLVSTPPPLMGLLDFFSRHSFERLFTFLNLKKHLVGKSPGAHVQVRHPLHRLHLHI